MMRKNDLFIISGFSLCFENVSATSLIDISQDLGGNCSFDLKANKATHYFEKRYGIDASMIKILTQHLETIGSCYAEKFECEYYSCVLHIDVDSSSYEEVDFESKESDAILV
jgi:hypothetical protein